jgi:hypothetical protein
MVIIIVYVLLNKVATEASTSEPFVSRDFLQEAENEVDRLRDRVHLNDIDVERESYRENHIQAPPRDPQVPQRDELYDFVHLKDTNGSATETREKVLAYSGGGPFGDAFESFNLQGK